MTKSTERARHASKPKSAVRHRKNKKRTGEAPKPAEGHVGKTDITPEAFFLAWGRRRKEALIEVLIDSLDAADSDPDLEDGGDAEPSLGSVSSCYGGGDQTDWSDGRGDDLEDSGLGNDDLEEVNEDSDGNPDNEPSIGWTAAEASRGVYSGWGERTADLEEDAGDSRECDPAEWGIADHDGLLEQVAGHHPGYGAAGFARAAI